MLANKDKALLSKQLVTLKDNVPVKDDPTSVRIKKIKKNNLYNFLREMEFNRLLSQAISSYGEDDENDLSSNFKKNKVTKIDTKLYKSILKEKELDNLVEILNKKVVGRPNKYEMSNFMYFGILRHNFTCKCGYFK